MRQNARVSSRCAPCFVRHLTSPRISAVPTPKDHGTSVTRMKCTSTNTGDARCDGSCSSADLEQRGATTRQQLKDELIRVTCWAALLSLPTNSHPVPGVLNNDLGLSTATQKGRQLNGQPSNSGQSTILMPPVGSRTKRILLARHGQVRSGRRLEFRLYPPFRTSMVPSNVEV